MKPAVHVRYHQSGLVSPRRELSAFARHVLRRCLREHQLPGAEMTVLFCSPTAMSKLNRQFRGLDEPTDVLSFPAEENGDNLQAQPAPYLGDLAICLPLCATQAAGNQHDPVDEVALLLVHGFLHLIGYDHDTAKNRRVMWKEQDRLLSIAKPALLPFLKVRGGR